MTTTIDRKLDCRGQSCPAPLINAKFALRDMEPGEVLQVTTDAAEAVGNFVQWTDSDNVAAMLLGYETTKEDGKDVFYIDIIKC